MQRKVGERESGQYFRRGCYGCPHQYGYLRMPEYCWHNPRRDKCNDCWDREIPKPDSCEKRLEANGRNYIQFWEEAHTIIDEALKKRDRSVSVFLHPEYGLSLAVY